MRLPPFYPPNIKCPCGSGKKYKKCCSGEVFIYKDVLFKAEREHPGTISRMLAAFDAESDERFLPPD